MYFIFYRLTLGPLGVRLMYKTLSIWTNIKIIYYDDKQNSVIGVDLSYDYSYLYIDGLVQERRIFSVLAMELRLSYTKPCTKFQ